MARLDRSGGQGIRAHSSPTPPSGTPLPSVPRDLLEYLESKFPNRLPPPNTPFEDIQRAWGRREVIDHLKEVQREIEQQNNQNVLLKP
jgi:hypothetical protein